MGRILVYPEELEAVSGQVSKAVAELQAMRDRLRSLLGAITWETHHRVDAEQLMSQAGDAGGAAAHAGESMAAFLKKKAADFVAADTGGSATTATRGPDPSLAVSNAVLTSGAEDAGIAAVTGAVAAATIPVATNTRWVKDKYPQQFQGDRPDPFMAAVGAAPLVTVNGELQFNPSFQAWADKFNRHVRANWDGAATDHAGTASGSLVETYELTPQKVQQIWTVAAQNHVDPKLLLAILQQEGTGSFDTNGANTKYYNGHGPQPDFSADLQAALDGPIMGKLRLYPKAVEAGFKGSWVDWVNWYTPMDTKGMQGDPGVYAADIHWGNGVAQHIQDIDAAMGNGTGHAVADYSAWMGQHPDAFQAQHIDGDFVIKPGLAHGASRPELAVWATSDTPPYPNARRDGNWWWFPAPDDYCWHIEPKA